MSVRAGIVLAIAAWIVCAVASAQPAYELRTMVVDPLASDDATQRFGLSKLREAYVCPECGYSSPVAGNCTNPLGIAGHPATALEGASLSQRVFGFAQVFPTTTKSCDIRYADTAGGSVANRFLAAVGRPFHPLTGTTPGLGNMVYAQLGWPGASGRVHFQTLPPGVKEAQAWTTDTPTGTVRDDGVLGTDDPWANNEAYLVNEHVTHNAKIYRCIAAHTSDPTVGVPAGNTATDDEPGVGANWQAWWEEAPDCQVWLNPQRTADGDTYYIRYFSRYQSTEGDAWRLQVYSRFYGLEFDGGVIGSAAPNSNTGHVRIVTASGAAIIRLRVRADANVNENNARWEWTFTTHSTARMAPSPGLNDPPLSYGQVGTVGNGLATYAAIDPNGDGALTAADDNGWENWGVYHVFYGGGLACNSAPVTVAYPAFEAGRHYEVGTHVLDGGQAWRCDVAGTASSPGAGDWTLEPAPAPQPYVLQAGETGVGRMRAQWNSGVVFSVSNAATQWNAVAGGTNEPTLYLDMGAGTFSEWWYDAGGNGPLNSDMADYPAPVSFAAPPTPVESRFLSSPVRVQATLEQDRHGVVEPSVPRWTTGTAFLAGDTVSHVTGTAAAVAYRCILAHSSTAGDEPGTAGGALYWVGEPANAYPRVLAGTDALGSGVVNDVVAPGGTTTPRVYRVRHEIANGTAYDWCPYCGATFATTVAQDRGREWLRRSDEHYLQDEGFGVCPNHGDHRDHTVDTSAPLWVSGTAYLVGQQVLAGTRVYACLRAHNASAADEPAAGADWREYWECPGGPIAAAPSYRAGGPLVGLQRILRPDQQYRCDTCGRAFDKPQDRGELWHMSYAAWAVGTAYVVGDRVRDAENRPMVYECTTAHTATAGAAGNEPGAGGPTGGWAAVWQAMPAHYPEDRGYGVCPFHGDHGDHTADATPAGRPGPGYAVYGYGATTVRTGLRAVNARTEHRLTQSLTAPEIGLAGVPYSLSMPSKRPQVPDSAVQIRTSSDYLPMGSAAPTYAGVPAWISLQVPRFQASSEPGDAPGNSVGYANNWGFRGSAVVYQQAAQGSLDDGDWVVGRSYVAGQRARHGGVVYLCVVAHTSAAGDEPGVGAGWAGVWSVAAQDQGWDATYRCPDCGRPYLTAPGAGGLLSCTNPGCPGHEWCPACGSGFPAGTGRCPYDQATLLVVSPGGGATQNFSQSDIGAELFDAYDVQVSVPKATQLAGGTRAAELGRVAPGVSAVNPDLTVAAAGGTPAGRFPAPANLSLWDRIVLRNEGNTQPILSGLDALSAPTYRLFRPDETPHQRAFVRAGMGNPIAAELIHGAYDGTATALPGAWQVPAATGGAGDGGTTTGLVGVGTGASATDVTGTGQALGRYSGQRVFFLDEPPFDGVFSFLRNGAILTNSGAEVFDPARDEAMEPYTLSTLRLRVSESRFPYNGYTTRDLAPTPFIEYGASGDPASLNVMWMSDAAGGGASDAPLNLVTQRATATGGGENMNYLWSAAGPATVDAGSSAMSQTGPVDVFRDGMAGTLYAVWHATERTDGGLRSVLRMSTKASGAAAWGPAVDVVTAPERSEGVRGFWDADVANAGAAPGPWLFWHSGNRGQERLMYAASLGGTEFMDWLPVDNSLRPGETNDLVNTVQDPDGIGPEVATAVTLRRFPKGPFTAVKDVSPMLYLPPLVYDTSGGGSATQPQIRVFFAGYARHLGNFDIYEARFNRHDLLAGINNNGKIEFERIGGGKNPMPTTEGSAPTNPTAIADGYFGAWPGEEFAADAQRQEFHSEHLDWSTTANFQNGPGAGDAVFHIGVRLAGAVPSVQYYRVSWGPSSPARGEGYDARQGTYTVVPRFERTDEAFALIPGGTIGGPVGAVQADPAVPWWELTDPATRLLAPAEQRPLQMQIDPALGQVRFSAPLFNTRNPGDTTCVFNSALWAQVVDVRLYGDYTPFLRRLTTSPADDDCPTAIQESGPMNGNQGTVASRPWPLNGTDHDLMLFWRRGSGSSEAPYYGRTCFMMRRWSWGFRLDYAPVDPSAPFVIGFGGAPALQGPGPATEIPGPMPAFPTLPARNEFDVDYTSGRVAIWPGTFRWTQSAQGETHAGIIGPGWTMNVTYTDIWGVTRTTPGRIYGWGRETVVPIDTVMSEGPPRVAEETYTVPPQPGMTGSDPTWPVAHRYWIFWTSTRPLYDLRAPADGGSGMRQSSDVFYCAVQPEFPNLIRERHSGSQAPNRMLP